MTINSVQFVIFFIIVFFLYYFPLRERTRGQNLLILVSSYVFYGIADWRMIPLLLMATGVFYALGRGIERFCKTAPSRAGGLTALGVCGGIGILLYFKYLNFFIASFSRLFTSLGFPVHPAVLQILMPAGVSFFTFKLISYCLEIYRGHLEAERDVVIFGGYIAFFPTLMAGPIDRPGAFLPQLHTARSFDYALAVDGCRQILWGAFKKMVISDSLAFWVDDGWNHIPDSRGINLILRMFIYTMQVYTDFSGYSDMSIGVAKVLGFRTAVNFRYPFFGRNAAELWRGYHMSLTSWITDYVFMPLNVVFRNWGKLGIIVAILINMLLVGLWHEANLTWVVFGLYNGILFIPLILTGRFNRKSRLVPGRWGLPRVKDFAGMLLTFVLFSIGVTVTRGANLEQVLLYFRQVTSWSSQDLSMEVIKGEKEILAIIALLVLEWYAWTHKAEYALAFICEKIPRVLRWTLSWGMAALVILFYLSNVPRGFIYFQF